MNTLNGGRIIDSLEIDNLQIDNRQIDNLSFLKIDSAIPFMGEAGLNHSFTLASWFR